MMISMIGFAYLYNKYPNSGNLSLKNPFILGIISVFVFFSAVRYDVGVDYPAYFSNYESYSIATNHEDSRQTEEGWAYFAWLLSKNGIHFTIYFGLIALFQIIFIIKSLRNKAQILPWAIYTFFTAGAFITTQNILRQCLVICVLVYIVLQKRNINFIWYILYVYLSILIHKSAILLLLIYPLIKINKGYINKTWIYIAIILIASVIGIKYNILEMLGSATVFVSVIEGGEYAYYLNEDNFNLGMGASIGLGFLLRVIVDVLIVANRKYVLSINNSDWIKIIFRLYFIGTSLAYLVPTSMVLNRPLLYLTFFTFVVYAVFVYYILNSKSLKYGFHKVSMYFVIVGLLFMFINSALIKPEGNMYEFHFFWELPMNKII